MISFSNGFGSRAATWAGQTLLLLNLLVAVHCGGTGNSVQSFDAATRPTLSSASQALETGVAQFVAPFVFEQKQGSSRLGFEEVWLGASEAASNCQDPTDEVGQIDEGLYIDGNQASDKFFVVKSPGNPCLQDYQGNVDIQYLPPEGQAITYMVRARANEFRLYLPEGLWQYISGERVELWTDRQLVLGGNMSIPSRFVDVDAYRDSEGATVEWAVRVAPNTDPTITTEPITRIKIVLNVKPPAELQGLSVAPALIDSWQNVSGTSGDKWRMISVPVSTPNAIVAPMKADASAVDLGQFVNGRNRQITSSYMYAFRNGRYEETNSPEPGEGLWVKAKDGVFGILGDASGNVGDIEFQVQEGWQLLGNPFTHQINLCHDVRLLSTRFESAFYAYVGGGYRRISCDESTDDTVQPFQGFWVKFLEGAMPGSYGTIQFIDRRSPYRWGH